MAKARGKPTAVTRPTLDASRFAQPTPPHTWLDDLSPDRRRYVCEIAKMFREGRATWSKRDVYDQLVQEIGLDVGVTTFGALLRGDGIYKHISLEDPQDAQPQTSGRKPKVKVGQREEARRPATRRR